MRIAFRVDISRKIGSGHFSRCLALADVLASRGHQTIFLIFSPDNHVANLIRASGHELVSFSKSDDLDGAMKSQTRNVTLHNEIEEKDDAHQTVKIIRNRYIDWMIVDHYHLGLVWQQIIYYHCKNILVVDDLAIKSNFCSILLNQNLGFTSADYKGLVPKHCHLLFGPDFALLRKEFLEWRDMSLSKRRKRVPRNILISLGGSDPDNITQKIIEKVCSGNDATVLHFMVVVGAHYPWKSELSRLIKAKNMNVEIIQDASNMAELMTNSDICIGAGGTTTWERICLGLPTIIIVIAKNQQQIANTLKREKIAVVSNINKVSDDLSSLICVRNKDQLIKLSEKSRLICDGFGTERVADIMEGFNE